MVICQLLPESLASQRKVYPVKIDHRWGYIDRRARDTLIPPRYDAIGPLVKPSAGFVGQEDPRYRLVEIAGKLGVIDQFKQEILPCSYDYVEVISADRFLVRDVNGFTVVDAANTNQLGELYHNTLRFTGLGELGFCYTIGPPDAMGLIVEGGDTLLPSRYSEVELLPHQKDRFKVKMNANGPWSLVKKGGQIIQDNLQHINSIAPELLLVASRSDPTDFRRAITPNGKNVQALRNVYLTGGSYLNDSLVQLTLVDQRRAELQTIFEQKMLFSISRQKQLAKTFNSFVPLDDRYVIGRRGASAVNGRSQGVSRITLDGTALDSNATFSIKKYGTTNLYKVRRRGGWGLMDEAGSMVFSCSVDTIGELKDSLAIIHDRRAKGLVNYRGETLLPLAFRRIIHKDRRITTYDFNGNASIFLLDSNYTISTREDLGSLRRIKLRGIGQKREMVEAEPVDFGRSDFDEVAALYRQLDPVDNDFANNDWFNANPTDKEPYKLFLRSTNAADSAGLSNQLTGPFTDLAQFSDLGFALLFPFRRPYSTKLTTLCGAKGGKGYKARLLNYSTGACRETPLLGIRAMDFHRDLPLAAAIDTSGQFVLVDSLGKVILNKERPLQFTYIGEFRNGLARVCIGGRLSYYDDGVDAYAERLVQAKELRHHFYLAFDRGSYRPYQTLVVRSTPEDSVRWGLIDTLGNWVIPPQYHFLDENVNGQMVARRTKKSYGVINALNQEIVPFQYLRIRFYRGYWRVNGKIFGKVYFNWRGHEMMSAETETVDAIAEGFYGQKIKGRWRFVNENGRPINNVHYLDLRPFGQGVAAVQSEEGGWKFIDSTGQVVKQWEKGTYQDFQSFSNGFCAFRKGTAWGFMDRNFKEILPPTYKKVKPFYLNRAVVTTEQGVGLIDSSGAFLLNPSTYRNISSINANGLALATNRRNERFIIDTSGQIRLSQSLQDAILTGAPPYPIQKNGRWGFIDTTGQISIYPAYNRVNRFNNGLAAVRKASGGPARWIKENGQFLDGRRYDRIFDFNNGLAVVGNQGSTNQLMNTNGQIIPMPQGTPLWTDGELIGCRKNENQYYTDQSGNLAFPQLFDEISPFGDAETAIVKIKGRMGLIDRRGMLLIRPKYFYLQRIPNSDIYEAGPPAFGIYNQAGEQIIPAEFDDIVLLEGDRFRVERGEKVGYLDTSGKVVWPLQN